MRVLFVLLGLLALATSAHADCAWVLWSRVHAPTPGAWEVQAAYPEVKDCTKAVDQREKEGRKGVVTEGGRKTRGVAQRRGPTELFMVYGSSGSEEGIAWQCFPDTVDPRGPKGK